MTATMPSSSNGSQADIRTVPELLEHADVTTTMVYTHVLNRPVLHFGWFLTGSPRCGSPAKLGVGLLNTR